MTVYEKQTLNKASIIHTIHIIAPKKTKQEILEDIMVMKLSRLVTM